LRSVSRSAAAWSNSSWRTSASASATRIRRSPGTSRSFGAFSIGMAAENAPSSVSKSSPRLVRRWRSASVRPPSRASFAVARSSSSRSGARAAIIPHFSHARSGMRIWLRRGRFIGT
jgi:hypothetical protein